MSRADGADAPYWKALLQGQLVLPRCGGCDRWMWPAGHRCGVCGSIGLRWEKRTMSASIFSWTRTWHRFAGTEGLDVPFTSVVAEVEDCGIRLLGLLDDPDLINPRIGEPILGRISETIVGSDRIPAIIWSRNA